jgi:DHA1 family multidrug resistance protein-like MFS transporter
MKARGFDKVILHLAVAANTVGLGVVLSLLADLQDAYDLPTGGLGLIAGSSFAAAFVAYLGLARFADRGHAKAMLMAGSLAGAVALVVMALADRLWMFVAARTLLGLAEGAFVPAARRVVLDWDPDRPGEVLGRITAASVGGFVLGPVLGGLVAPRFGLRLPFLLPAAVLLVAVPVITRLRAPDSVADGPRRGLASLFRSRLVVAGLLFVSVDFLTFGVFDAVWARLLADRGATTAFIGFSFGAAAVPLMVLAPGLGRLVDRRSAASVALPGLVVLLAAVTGYGMLETPGLLTAAGLLHGAGAAAIAPAGAALVAAGSPPDMIARGQGLMEAVGFVVAAAAALPAGWAYEAVGRGVMFGAVAALGAVLTAVGWFVGRREPSAAARSAP